MNKYTSILQWNSRGLISKWAEAKHFLLHLAPLLICIQETHFITNDKYDFSLKNFTAYHTYSQCDTRQGGVSIYACNFVPHYRLNLNTGL